MKAWTHPLKSMRMTLLFVLVSLAAYPARATFEGENGNIAFVSYVPVASGPPTTRAIYTLDGQRLTFTDPAVGEDRDPAYSPDGERIAYIQYRISSQAFDTSIRIMNADGSGDHQILNSASIHATAELSSPSWSADGQKIAVSVRVDGAMMEGGIFTLDPDGGNLVRVVENESSIYQLVYEPQWSPRGRKLAYRCRVRGQPLRVDDLCTLDTNSGDFRMLPIDIMDLGVAVPLAARLLRRPVWTPDGQRLVFTASYPSTDIIPYFFPGGSGATKYQLKEVFSIRKDGTKLERVSPRGRPVFNPPVIGQPWSGVAVHSDLGFSHAIPSPDGELIFAFGGGSGGNGAYRLERGGPPALIKKFENFGPIDSQIEWQSITATPAVTVTDGHGHAMEGLKVELRSKDDINEVLYAEPTQAGNGTYVFKNAPLGEYGVRVTLVDTTAPAGLPPSFDVRMETAGTPPSPVANMDRRVVFTGTAPKTISFDDSDLDNLLGTNVDGDRLDDLAAIFRNMNLYVGWVRRNLQPDTGPTARIVAFSSYSPDPNSATYLDDLDVIVMGPAKSAYENRDGIPDFPAHRDDAPENGEWHEFTHHLTHHHVRSFTDCPSPHVNHLGYPNPSTCDSLIEGLAEFFPAIAEREITGQANSWYATIGDIERHVKAWRPWPDPEHPNATAEDLAVAALLWDLVDSNVDLEFAPIVIGASGDHVLAPPWRDDLSMSPSELWEKLKFGSPLTVTDLRGALSTPATTSSAITVDLDGVSPADVSPLDLLFLMHGFYAAVSDINAPGLHPVEHYDVASAQRLDPFSPRNAHVGRTDHFIHDPAGATLGGIVPRLDFPANPGAQLSVEVRDTAGNPLSGATVQLELPHTDFETAPLAPTGPSQRFETGSGVMSFEPPFFVDYPLAEGGALPACDDPNVTHVPVTVSATLNGHASLNQPVIDNCAYWQMALAGTTPAASVTLTFPAEAALPVTTAYTDLVPAEGGRPAFWAVELDCTDAGAGNFASGCARTEYRIGDGPIEAYDRPLRLPPPVQRLEIRSVDSAGNAESFREVDFDSDSDGLTDAFEIQQGMNPLSTDSDGDASSDATDNCPVIANADQLDTDADSLGDVCDDDDDGDGLSDAAEISGGTDPLDPDTDGDGLLDPAELALGTSPIDADSDDDELVDGDELARATDPIDPDSDDDGLQDGYEVVRGTSPLDPDSDDDGIDDAVDNCALLANPGQEDLDGDAVGDVCDPSVGSAWKLIGVTGDSRFTNVQETLFELDTSNASGTFVMTLGNGGSGEAIAFNPTDGLLYHGSGTVDGDKVWESIDMTTRTILTSQPLTTPSGAEVGAMTYNAATGRFLVAVTDGELFDTTLTGSTTSIGRVDRPKGIAFVGEALYAATLAGDTLYRVNPSTGAYISDVRVQLAGVSINSLYGLATHPETGVLWILINQPGQTQYLATVDPVTGVATSVGILPDGFAGIAFVPEPSSRLSLGAGAVVMAFCAMRRRRRHPMRISRAGDSPAVLIEERLN